AGRSSPVGGLLVLFLRLSLDFRLRFRLGLVVGLGLRLVVAFGLAVFLDELAGGIARTIFASIGLWLGLDFWLGLFRRLRFCSGRRLRCGGYSGLLDRSGQDGAEVVCGLLFVSHLSPY